MSIEENHTHFQSLLEQAYKEFLPSESNPMLLQRLREKAWLHFQNLKLPSKKGEAYRNFKLRSLFNSPIALAQEANALSADLLFPHLYPSCQNSCLVFINGYFSPSLSRLEAVDEEAFIYPLDEGIASYSALLTNHWNKSLKEESDPFAALNGALHQRGAFVYLPRKKVLEAPVQILNVFVCQEAMQMFMPRLHIFAGAESSAQFIQTSLFLDEHHRPSALVPAPFVNRSVELTLEEGARVDYVQNLSQKPAEGWHFDALRASLKRDSRLQTVCVADGGGILRCDYRVVLAGENAEALLNGVAMLSKKDEAHTHVLLEHQAPHCRSFQLFKNVLKEMSRASFEGKIHVHQAAQKTEAFQLNNNLLLGDHAYAYSKPNLEIFADDVKASHGATVGQLDEEQLFYMQARGLSSSLAKNLLIFGFCDQVIQKLSIPFLRDRMSHQFRDFLNGDG